METSNEGEPEHYSCMPVYREQQWRMSQNALQGLIEEGAPVHSSLLSGCSPFSPLPNGHFWCALHRVACYHDAFTDTIFMKTSLKQVELDNKSRRETISSTAAFFSKQVFVSYI